MSSALLEAPTVDRSTITAAAAESPADSAPTVEAPADDRSTRTRDLLEQLHACADDGSEAARREFLAEEVVRVNMPVAEGVARRYRNRGIDEDDLRQVAYLGLVKAVRGFDPSYGRDFLSFAVPTVSGEVKRHFRDHGWMVRPTRRVQELLPRIASAREDLQQRLGRAARPTEIAAELMVDVEEVIEALSADGCFTPTSLEAPAGATGTVADRLWVEDAELERAEARILLDQAMSSLCERDRRIVELRFVNGLTQEQVGAEIGVSQMQVSRLLRRILGDLRRELAA